MSHAMTLSEREAFLADLHVGVIGIAADGRSIAVPIWYDYAPGGDVWVFTDPSSIKGRAIEETGRFSLCAQTEDPPYKYVTVEGPVSAAEQCTDEVLRAMAKRYLGEELGETYADNSNAPAIRVYRMTPESWFTVDYSKDLSG